jgi:hypothetical protein
MNRRQFLQAIIYGGAAIALTSGGIICSEYTDLPGVSDKAQAGRTKNSIAAVVAGILGQKLYGHSRIDLEMSETFHQFVTGG